MTPSPELLTIILSEFQDVLRENLSHEWQPVHGRPPKYGYVEHTQFTAHELGKGSAITAWQISAETVRECTVKQLAKPAINGMFFEVLIGWFYFTEDAAFVHVCWQIGPRFGRGFQHQVGRDTLNRYLISRGTNTWVS